MRRLVLRTLVLVGLGLSFASCKQGSTATETQSAKESPPADFAPLFKDRQDFSDADLQSFTSCSSISSGDVRAAFKPWPKPLAGFLEGELKKHPLASLFQKHVFGIYLIEFTAKDPSYDNYAKSLHGIVCYSEQKDLSFVLLSESTMLDGRANPGSFGGSSRSVAHELGGIRYSGDLGLATFFHELFHVADNHLYLSPLISDAVFERRKQIMDLSWRSVTSSKFKSLTSFTMDPADRPVEPTAEPEPLELRASAAPTRQDFLTTDAHPFSPSVGVALTAASKPTKEQLERVVAGFTYFQQETNLITQYATVNALEDFATSLENYYTLTRYQYGEDVIFSDESGRNHSFLARETAGFKAQKEKLCLLAKVVLQEDCRL